MFKKVLTMFMVAMMLVACLATAVPAMAASEEVFWGDTTDTGIFQLYLASNGSEYDSGELPSYVTAAVRFNALNGFDTLYSSSMFGGAVIVRYTLYSWVDDYDTTVAQTAVWTGDTAVLDTYVTSGDSISIGSTIPAGEYLLVFSVVPADDQDRARIFKGEICNDPDNIEYYVDGDKVSDDDETTSEEAFVQCIAGGIRYVDTANGTGFGALSVSEVPTSTPTEEPTEEPTATTPPATATKTPSQTTGSGNTVTTAPDAPEESEGSNIILYILLAVGGVVIVAAVVILVIKNKKK